MATGLQVMSPILIMNMKTASNEINVHRRISHVEYNRLVSRAQIHGFDVTDFLLFVFKTRNNKKQQKQTTDVLFDNPEIFILSPVFQMHKILHTSPKGTYF